MAIGYCLSTSKSRLVFAGASAVIAMGLAIPSVAQAVAITPKGTQTFIDAPTWRVADLHTFSSDVNGPSNVLTGPNHALHNDLGVGPGDPHGSFDREITDGLVAAGILDKTQFTFDEFDLDLTTFAGNVVWTGLMVHADPVNAPVGATPDGDIPMIPNSLFPINTTGTVVHNSVTDTTPISVPPLDDQLNPPFPNIDGHSHFPLFLGQAAAFYQGTTINGQYDVTIEIMDADGNGYIVTTEFSMIPEPASLLTFGLLAVGISTHGRSRR